MPAVAGSNVPFEVLVIPVPLHVPPEVAAVRSTAVPLKQNGPAGSMLASRNDETVMYIVSVSGQGPVVV
ncbi:hypothetical protein SDC9_112787 [bioreactor metagenome]|uniref:Uncharacterized protein n=1 Tax=bioreactor metagenome TaxID=1076179 RepID=A0A645BRM9_9ZZZZ